MSIRVNIDVLVKKYELDPDKFRPGMTYPLTKLMKELNLSNGTPKLKSGGKAKK